MKLWFVAGAAWLAAGVTMLSSNLKLGAFLALVSSLIALLALRSQCRWCRDTHGACGESCAPVTAVAVAFLALAGIRFAELAS